jgi:hypothetical protein
VKHVWHASEHRLLDILDEFEFRYWYSLVKQMHREYLLEIDPPLKIAWDIKLLKDCLPSHLVSIEIPT